MSNIATEQKKNKIIESQWSMLNNYSSMEEPNFEDFFKEGTDETEKILTLNHTIRDGIVIRLEILRPLVVNETLMKLDILGPFWDRVSKIRFHGVSEIECTVNVLDFPEIKSISASKKEKNKKSVFVKTFYDKNMLNFNYRYASLVITKLNEPITREMITKN